MSVLDLSIMASFLVTTSGKWFAFICKVPFSLLGRPCCFPGALTLCTVLVLKTITCQSPFSIRDKVLFQTEKIIRKLTGIPVGTIVFVMRKLCIIEVRELGLGSGEMLNFCLKGWTQMPIIALLEAHFSSSCPNMPITAFLMSCCNAY